MIAVIGSGLMGTGIAQTCAQAGFPVVNIDISETALKKGEDAVRKLFEKKIQTGKLSVEEAGAVTDRITYSSSFEEVSGASVVIEAVPENIEIKKETFRNLDKYTDNDAVLLTNTSGLSISEIASVTSRPWQVMGLHFFYPAPVMKLVEVIRGIATSEEVYRKVRAFALALGKEPVDAPEYPGFLVNRMLVPMQNEAAFLVMEGCSPEDVDRAMKLGANHPMGPLELTDLVGIDTMLSTMNGLYQGFKDSKYRPCPLLENMVKAGRLGRKTGQGFYKYQ